MNDETVTFSEVYTYGTSPRNVRIESWWGEMSDGQSEQWLKFFENLKGENLFNGCWADVTAIRYIYLPEIRRQLQNFVMLWNAHTIRKQRNRDYLPTGKVSAMYYYPNLKNESARKHEEQPNPTLLAELKEEVKDFDHELYQDPAVEAFCSESLRRAGFPPISDFNYSFRNRQHVDTYIHLRTALAEREATGNPLPRIEKPFKAEIWIREKK